MDRDPRIISSGIDAGHVLEVGPGPGYLGLEWLSHTSHTHLTGLEISEEMIQIALKNAAEYELQERVRYVHDDARSMPFEDNSFDCAFSNGSLHEWAEPCIVLEEIHRVLKPGGRYFVSDLRRDINIFTRAFFYLATKPRYMREGLKTSLQASYTADELRGILASTCLESPAVAVSPIGLTITGCKMT